MSRVVCGTNLSEGALRVAAALSILEATQAVLEAERLLGRAPRAAAGSSAA